VNWKLVIAIVCVLIAVGGVLLARWVYRDDDEVD
jgi:hypothetical protein